MSLKSLTISMISRISKMMRNGEDADAVVTEDADGAEETLRTMSLKRNGDADATADVGGVAVVMYAETLRTMSLRRNGEDADAETLRTMSLKRRKSAADVDADADAESLKVTRPKSLKSLTISMISRISKLMRNGEDADADVIEDTVVVTEDADGAEETSRTMSLKRNGDDADAETLKVTRPKSLRPNRKRRSKVKRLKSFKMSS